MRAIVCDTGRPLDRGLTPAEILDIIGRTKQGHIPEHPEAKWLRPHCRGLSVDIGCGHEKVLPGVLGIDKLAFGQRGATGSMLQMPSAADIQADAGNLYFIADGTFDSAVSRHCFEHLPDPVATLREWLRIVKTGGTLAMVLPNDDWCDFMAKDPDHKFRCYPKTVAGALAELNISGAGIRGDLLENGTMVHPQWSFFSLIRRLPS